MTIDERSRHQLFQRLDEVLGTEAASTMMALVPPVGWADVATKHDVLRLKDDLAQLEERMDLRFEALDSRFETLEHKLLGAFRGELNSAIQSQTRSLAITLVGTFMSIAGLALGVLLLR